jgi:hypothetical protein
MSSQASTLLAGPPLLQAGLLHWRDSSVPTTAICRLFALPSSWWQAIFRLDCSRVFRAPL